MTTGDDLVKRMRDYNGQRRVDLKRRADIPLCSREKCAAFMDEAISEIERLQNQITQARSLILHAQHYIPVHGDRRSGEKWHREADLFFKLVGECEAER
jgi:hypothetical protein